MSALILVVEDEPLIRQNVKLMLELEGFEVKAAENGIKALEIIKNIEPRTPDLVLSDINMPGMDGYQLFKEISKKQVLSLTPFIFLSARDTPEDVRFGKLLGVDDYITKPFEAEDLIAIIRGKINRQRQISKVNQKFSLENAGITVKGDFLRKNDPEDIFIIIVIWDDKVGPDLRLSYPVGTDVDLASLKFVGQQLFQAIVAMYGDQARITKSEGILLHVENIGKMSYIFFDSYKDASMRAREFQYMIGILSNHITYFDSFKLKGISTKLSNQIKVQKNLDINLNPYFIDILNILTE